MSRHPTILYLVGGLAVGGTENHLSQLLPALKRRGWTFTVLRLGDDGPLSAPLHAAGINIVPIEARHWPPLPKLRGIGAVVSQVTRSAAIIRHARPDILHTFLGQPTIVGGFAHILARNGQLVVSKRNQMARPDSFLGEGKLERWVLRRATAVLAHSSAVRDEIAAIGIASNRISMIYSGIDILRYSDARKRRDAVRAAFGWTEETIILMLANLIPYKGHADVIPALARLPREDTPRKAWRAVFVGAGDSRYQQELKELASSAGIQNRIDFLGERVDVPDLLAAADIGLLASHHEGFANAILEYMAAGLCTIATAVGGNLDIIEDEINGYLYPVGNGAALTATLQRLLDDRAQRAEIGRRAIAHVQCHFNFEGCVDKYEAIYRRLFAGSGQ